MGVAAEGSAATGQPVEMRELGWGPFLAVALFVSVLAVGLLYEWKKGGLEWD